MITKRWQVRRSSCSARAVLALLFRICARGVRTICKYPTRMVGRRCRNGKMRTDSLVKSSSNHTRAGDEVEPVLDLPYLHSCDKHRHQSNLNQQGSPRTSTGQVASKDLYLCSCRMKSTSRRLTQIRITRISRRLFFRRMSTIPPWHVYLGQWVRTAGDVLRPRVHRVCFRWIPSTWLRISATNLSPVSRRCRTRNRRENSVRQWTSLQQGIHLYPSSTFQREQEQILKTKTDRLSQEMNLFLR